MLRNRVITNPLTYYWCDIWHFCIFVLVWNLKRCCCNLCFWCVFYTLLESTFDHLLLDPLVFVYNCAKITNRNIVFSKLQMLKTAISFLCDDDCYWKISENNSHGVALYFSSECNILKKNDLFNNRCDDNYVGRIYIILRKNLNNFQNHVQEIFKCDQSRKYSTIDIYIFVADFFP